MVPKGDYENACSLGPSKRKMFTIGKQLKAKVSGILQGAAGGSGILQHSTAHEAGLLREHPPREGQERVGALEGWPERGAARILVPP